MTFSKDENSTSNSSLVGAYFIGVYGYTYTTFSIIAHVNRSKHEKIDEYRGNSVQLY